MLEDLLNSAKISYSRTFIERITTYKEILLKWNKTHSLTNITREDELDRYIFDSIYPVTFVSDFQNCIDIGTGAGFPGFVLALYFQNKEFWLCEPLAKRASFLTFAKLECDAQNITIKSKRVENLEPRIFDLITSRAVMSTSKLLKISRNFYDENSQILLYKGENVEDEVEKSVENYEIIKHNKLKYLYIKGK